MTTESDKVDDSQLIWLLEQGNLAYQAGTLGEAKSIYEKALSIDTKNLQALSGLAKICYEQKQPDAAKQLLEKIFSIQPDYPPALVTMGSLCEDAEEAEKLYKKALKLDPGLINAKYNLGGMYFQSSKFDQAESLFLECVNDDPEFKLAPYMLAELYLYKKNYSKAEKYYQQVIRLDPTHQHSLLELANIAFYKGEYEPAFRLFIQVQEQIDKAGLKLGDNSGFYYLQKGKCAHHLSRHDMALAAFLEAVKFYPLDVELNYALSSAYYNNGNLPNSFQNAALYCIQAIELKPENDSLYKHLWLIDYVKEIPEEMEFWNSIIERLYKILKTQPEFLDIAKIIIAIYKYQARYQEALKAIEDFKTKFPGEEEIHRWEAHINNALGENEKSPKKNFNF